MKEVIAAISRAICASLRRLLPAGMAAGLLAWPTIRADADMVRLTLDHNTVPEGLACGQAWSEEGLTLSVLSTGAGCSAEGRCAIHSVDDRLDLLPGVLSVDLRELPGTVISAEAIVSAVCEGCASLVLYRNLAAIDQDVNSRPAFGIPADTLTVQAGTADVNRLTVEGCFETSVFEIRIEFQPATTSVGPGGRDIASVLSPPSRNPMTRTTQVRYVLAEEGRVSLNVYDVRGRFVACLVEGRQGLGEWSVVWDGRDETGRTLAPGVYYLRLMVNGRHAASTKAVLLEH